MNPKPITRRSVAHGAVWATPAVLSTVAAPALALSPCAPRTYLMPLSTKTYKRRDKLNGSGTWAASGTLGGEALTYTVSSVVVGSKTIVNNNGSVAGDTQSGYNGVGDLDHDGWQFQQSDGSVGYANRQSMTVTFGRPVTGLQFTIADIDALTGSYVDNVALTPGFKVLSRGSVVLGSGTPTDPFKKNAYGAVNSDDTTARVTVKYEGPLTSFTIDFWSATGTTGQQQIFLTGMSATAPGC